MTVYQTRSTMKKTSSRQFTSREQLLVKDAITVATLRPERSSVLSELHSETSGSDLVQPSQEGEVVQEEGRQEPKPKRRKLSEALVQGGPNEHGSDLGPGSEKQTRAEDGEPDDLDREDAVDPCMEPEYQVECYQYMRELEVSGGYL